MMLEVRFPRRAGTARATALGALSSLALVGAAAPAYAIPSPELVIGSLSSLSQVAAVLTAGLGGVALVGAGIGVSRARAERRARLLRQAALGLLALVLILGGLNLYQYHHHQAERLERLQATLIRPSRNPGEPVLDPSLKELNFQQQTKHPLGISTDEAQTLLDEAAAGLRDDVVLLDVRETAETAMGTLPNATVVRWPDLAKAKLNLAGKKPILFCHNGNRSHETCEALAAQGIDCRFIVGGLEKWVVEHRQMTGLSERTIDDLRAIPPYRNDDVLLDTKEVQELVQRENAIFVDVRYPGEFAARHLPNAINLPIRRLPTEELKARINELPKQPIIMPCYDRRSCFFSEVLGLELDRAGHDVRGRYTLPWEYFAESARPPHVIEWQARNERSLWGKAVAVVADALRWVAGGVGLVPALLLLALASRLAVLPVSVKAERDQMTARRLEDQYQALRQRLRDDPVRRARAIRAFYREHGLTPALNLLALLFLPLLALSVGAVQQVANQAGGAFLWIPDLAKADPLYLLPLAGGLLFAAYLELALARRWWHRAIVWLIAFPVLAGGGAFLSAAVQLYVTASALLLLAQRAFLDRARIAKAIRSLRAPDLVALDDADVPAHCGNKAHRLGRLKAVGIPVPDGIVLTPDFLAGFERSPAEARARVLDRVWAQLGGRPVAVRSSAESEDGRASSFAGVFDSVLRVGRAELEDAVLDVIASFRSERAASYGVDPGRCSILVQHMVEAEYAGVLFTRAPDHGGQALVELVPGTAEALVSGSASPQAYRFGRASGQELAQGPAPIDLLPLLAIGRRAEDLFGAPQDIEWTYRDGKFLIVQSRDVTRFAAASDRRAALEDERARALARAKGAARDEPFLIQNGLSETLPRPTPLSLSLMAAIWAPGGSVDLACRALGLEYRAAENAPSPLVTVFGRLYVDRREEIARGPRLNAWSLRRITAAAGQIEQTLRESFMPDFLQRMALLEATDFRQLETQDLFAALRRITADFVERTYAEVETVNIAAQICLDQARDRLRAARLDPTRHLTPMPDTIAARALAQAFRFSGEERRRELLRSFGHRSLFDYELAAPRYSENAGALEAFALASLPPQSRPEAELPATAGKGLREAVQRSRRLQALKEDAKHVAMHELALVRRVVLALDERLDLGGLAFHLTVDELLAAERNDDFTALRPLAQARADQAGVFAAVPPLPPMLTPEGLETAMLVPVRPGKVKGGAVRGTRVSGSGLTVGRACVVAPAQAERGGAIAGFQDGDIIVSSMIHPGWLPYFRRARGLVCEVGSWLSHTAILARENNLAMVVGARPLANIQHGTFIAIDVDGCIESVTDPADARLTRLAAE